MVDLDCPSETDTRYGVETALGDDGIRQAIGRALEQFLGPTAQESGQAIADQVRFFRWRAAMKIIERAKRYAEKKGLSTSDVPLRFLVPFLEQASLQEEDSQLSEMWSALLAKARDEYKDRYASFLSILSALSPTEAATLRDMWQSADPHDLFSAWAADAPMQHLQPYSEAASTIGGHILRFKCEVTASDFMTDGAVVYFFDEDDVPNMNELNFRDMDEFTDLIHLQSLGLVSVLWSTVVTPKHRHFVVVGRISPFGYDFLETCEGTQE
jgi:abortive infection alpha-like protein